jgi:hypothetical protein
MRKAASTPRWEEIADAQLSANTRERKPLTFNQWLGVLAAVTLVIGIIITAATGGFRHTWADCVSGVFAAEHVGPFNGPSPTTMYDAQVKCGQGHGKVYSDLYTITLGPRELAVPPSTGQ